MKEEKKKRYVIGLHVFGCWFYLTNLKMKPFSPGRNRNKTPHDGETSSIEFFRVSKVSAPVAVGNCPSTRCSSTTYCHGALEAKMVSRTRWGCATNVTSRYTTTLSSMAKRSESTSSSIPRCCRKATASRRLSSYSPTSTVEYTRSTSNGVLGR